MTWLEWSIITGILMITQITWDRARNTKAWREWDEYVEWARNYMNPSAAFWLTHGIFYVMLIVMIVLWPLGLFNFGCNVYRQATGKE